MLINSNNESRKDENSHDERVEDDGCGECDTKASSDEEHQRHDDTELAGLILSQHHQARIYLGCFASNLCDACLHLRSRHHIWMNWGPLLTVIVRTWRNSDSRPDRVDPGDVDVETQEDVAGAGGGGAGGPGGEVEHHQLGDDQPDEARHRR